MLSVGPFRSAVSRGAFYESVCSQALGALLPMRLRARGGAGDRGVDLEGSLEITAATSHDGGIVAAVSNVSVLAQCKCRDSGAPVGEPAVRALAATLAAAAAVRRAPIAGIFYSSTPFTRPAVRTAFSTPIPLMLAQISMGGWQFDGDGWRGAAAVKVLAANRAWLAAFPSLRLTTTLPESELRLLSLDGDAVRLRLIFSAGEKGSAPSEEAAAKI